MQYTNIMLSYDQLCAMSRILRGHTLTTVSDDTLPPIGGVSADVVGDLILTITTAKKQLEQQREKSW